MAKKKPATRLAVGEHVLLRERALSESWGTRDLLRVVSRNSGARTVDVESVPSGKRYHELNENLLKRAPKTVVDSILRGTHRPLDAVPELDIRGHLDYRCGTCNRFLDLVGTVRRGNVAKCSRCGSESRIP